VRERDRKLYTAGWLVATVMMVALIAVFVNELLAAALAVVSGVGLVLFLRATHPRGQARPSLGILFDKDDDDDTGADRDGTHVAEPEKPVAPAARTAPPAPAARTAPPAPPVAPPPAPPRSGSVRREAPAPRAERTPPRTARPAGPPPATAPRPVPPRATPAEPAPGDRPLAARPAGPGTPPAGAPAPGRTPKPAPAKPSDPHEQIMAASQQAALDEQPSDLTDHQVQLLKKVRLHLEEYS
jgi:hypothetical protein